MTTTGGSGKVREALAACLTPSPTSDYYEIVKREGREVRERAVALSVHVAVFPA